MCRWFAYISPEEPCLLSDVLITPANSISKQISEHFLPHILPHDGDHDLHRSKDWLIRIRNSLLNIDGLGVAWYTPAAAGYIKAVNGMRPATYKSISPPPTDLNFRSICDNTETRCLFAHVRASSGSAVVVPNNHPFVFGRHIFMHNGIVTGFSRIHRQLAGRLDYECFNNIQGNTDSEHVAALYVSLLTDGGGPESWQREYSLEAMKSALTRTLLAIMQLQHEVLGDDAAPSSLNICVSDGAKMIAVRFRNHATEQPPSLYWSDVAGRTLNRKYPGHPDHDGDNPAAFKAAEAHGKHVIVSSEPTTFDRKQWTLIKRNCMVAVDERGQVTEEKIEYDDSFNFDDPWETPPPGFKPPHVVAAAVKRVGDEETFEMVRKPSQPMPPTQPPPPPSSSSSSAWMWPWKGTR